MIRRSSLALLLLAPVTAPVAHADDADPCACSPNKPGFYRKGALSGDWGGERDKLRDQGFTLMVTYSPEVFSAPSIDHHPAIAGLGVIAIDLDLAALVTAGLGALHVAGLGIHGKGLSNQLGDVYGVSNNVAARDVRVFEAWYEQPLAPLGPLTVRAGILSADQEFVLSRYSTALLNATFGIISMLAFDAQPPVYPVGTLGASVHYDGAIGVRAAIYDGDQHNSHGIPSELGTNKFVIGELELGKLLKLGAWNHSALGTGVYAVADRRLERYVSAFARLSVSPSSPVNLYIDTGIRIGPGPLRERDFASIGMAFARTAMGPQTAVEATYQLQLGWVTIQPDLQLLLLRDRTAGVIATRMVFVL